MICSRKRAGRMLLFPTLTFFWRVQGGSYLYQICENEISFKIGKIFPYSLNLLLPLDKEIHVPVIEKMLFSSPFISCSISILRNFPLKHFHNSFTIVHEYLLSADIFLFASSQSHREEIGTGIKTQSYFLWLNRKLWWISPSYQSVV